MEPLLQDLGELSDAEAERIIQNLLPESRSLGNFVLVLLVWGLVAILP